MNQPSPEIELTLAEMLRLPEPPADPARLAAALQKMQQIERSTTGKNTKSWAYPLKARHDAGEILGQAQLRCMRSALGLEKEAA